MDYTKGIAYCGLACCLCGHDESCVGCRNEGCKDKEICKSFICCREKGLEGCWQCPDFPCEDPIFNTPRVRAFVSFIAEYGQEQLMRALEKNESDGMRYHYEGQLSGDYDVPKTEEEIIKLLIRDL